MTQTADASSAVPGFFHDWLEKTVRPTRRPNTYRLYRWLLTNHPFTKAVGDITTKDVEALLDTCETARRKEIVRIVYGTAFKRAVKLGLIATNPVTGTDAPKVEQRPMKVWDEAQATKFLAAAADDRLYAAFVLLVTCGLRKGELCGLQKEDVDYKGKTLKIQRQHIEVGGGRLGLYPPKSNSGRRSIVLPGIAVTALKSHAVGQLERGWGESPFVFCEDDLGPLRQKNLERRFKRLIKKAGVPDIRFHDLRHTSATLLLSKGVHAKIVQERLGHKDVMTTLQTYAHVLPSMQKEAAERMEEMFSPR